MITPLVFVMVVACTHLVKKMLVPAKQKNQIVQPIPTQKTLATTARKAQHKHVNLQQQQPQKVIAARAPASIQTQAPVQFALSVEDHDITAQEQELLAEKERKEYNELKEAEFLRQSLGLGDVEIAAVHQQLQSHAQEIAVYNRQINAGMMNSQLLKEEAIKLHQQWMEDHIGAENYQMLLSFLQ